MRLTGFCGLFVQNKLLALQPFNTFFKGGHDTRVGDIRDLVHKLIDLPLDVRRFLLHGLNSLGSVLRLQVPIVFKHGGGGLDDTDGRRDVFEQRGKFTLNLVTGDGFAFLIAAFFSAEVIRVMLVFTLAPSGGELVAT
ncbi:MAG: hypothetical protein AAGC95_01780 [Pseudomonadota bacterium]